MGTKFIVRFAFVLGLVSVLLLALSITLALTTDLAWGILPIFVLWGFVALASFVLGILAVVRPRAALSQWGRVQAIIAIVVGSLFFLVFLIPFLAPLWS